MKENKFFIVKIGTFLFILLLLFSLRSYALKVEVKAEEPDYSGGAKVKISADENMKKIKIYKKISNNQYILFYIGKPKAKELTIVVPNSKLSTESKTDIKVVAYNDKGESATSDGSIDKVKPRVSMNPEETAKPSWSPSPVPTKPTPTTSASASASTSPSASPSSSPATSQEPETSAQPVDGAPMDVTPGKTEQEYNGMKYYQIIPDDPVENMPLIVFLHGDGESKNFKSVGSLPITKYVESKKAYQAGKFVFIAPHQSKYSWNSDGTVKTLMALIEKVSKDYKIDKNRIILTGMSRGGIGTWYIANKYPNYFAAIVPMSGSSSINGNNFVNTPVWAIAGSAESNYITNMKANVNKVNKAAGKNIAKMEIVKGATHSTIQQSYKRLELFQWMLAQGKKQAANNNANNDTNNNTNNNSDNSSNNSSNPINVAPGMTVQNSNGMNFVQIIPDNPTENMPLIVFLHGSGEIGNVNGVKNLPITTYVSSKQAYAAGKFLFIAPVLNGGHWTDSGSANATMNIIEEVANKYKVDKGRIILTGMSRGGHGVWYLGATHPDKFAAIVPMSGIFGINPANLKDMPIWAICGTSGELEEYFRPVMTNLVNQIKAAGNKNVKLEVIQGATHNTIQGYYKRPELFKWMLEQKK